VEFRILGPLEVTEDGQAVALGGAKQRGLLAFLLLHANHVVPRDRLIDELWETDPPDTARTALQVHVSQLRKALGRDRIVTQAPGYLVRVEPGELDLERFEQLADDALAEEPLAAAATLREALALWRGPLLADLDDSLARAERGGLEEQRALALERRIDADLALGRHAGLVPELDALVRQAPLRERLRAQLMVALYRCGRQADALEVYRQGRRLLAEELGLEPGEDLRRLERAILEQDSSLARPQVPRPRPSARLRGGLRRRLPLAAAAAGALLLAAAVIAGITLAMRESPTVVIRPNSVVAVDARTGARLANVPIGGRPVALAVGASSIWVADGDHATVSRIDVRTKERLPIGGLGPEISDVAFGFGALWVAGGNAGTLARVDARYNSITPIDLGSTRDVVPHHVFDVRAGADAVWVTRGNQLLRVDPGEMRVTDRLPVRHPLGIAVGLGSVWVAREDEHIVRVDARTVRPTYPPQDVSKGVFSPVVAYDSLWVVAVGLVGDPPRVWRLDPGTLEQRAVIPFPTPISYARLAAGSGALWAVDPDTRTVWRIDPDTNRRKRLAKLPHYPFTVAADGGVVWVGVQAEPPG
jgi:DNA-binding SARP family transcriptional activator